jgi:hypothetical protein
VILLGLAFATEPQLLGQERLPDFSWAGYKGGEEPPANKADGSVDELGAVANDGLSDRDAFQLAADKGGVWVVPEGTYVIDHVVRISKPVVFRGHDAVLELPNPLEVLFGEAAQWSWNGGIFWVSPAEDPVLVKDIARSYVRGEVFEEAGLLVLTDDAEHTMGWHLHNDQAGPGDCDWQTTLTLRWPTDGTQPLRFDVRPEWTPQLYTYPAVSEVGFEGLVFQFPDEEYPGHLDERGYNAIFFEGGVRDSWVRNVTFINADNGVLTDQLSKNLLVADIRFQGRMGHHGFNVAFTADSLFRDVHYEQDFIHAMTVDHRSSGNVFMRFSSEDLELEMDHHRDSPFENLFVAFEATPNFINGGSWCAGDPGGARNTFWGLPGPLFEPYWSGNQTNLVGSFESPDSMTADAEWVENLDEVSPKNLYLFQRAERLGLDYADTGAQEPVPEPEGDSRCSGCAGAGSAFTLSWVAVLALMRRARA